jgi:hypothetical protein
MRPKKSSIVSKVLTTVILVVIGITILFVEIIALNGFSDREAGPALLTALICHSASAILVVILVGRLAPLLITKFNWNGILAVMVSVLAGALSGGFLFILATVLSIILAMVLWEL